jgi:hypothetical protein
MFLTRSGGASVANSDRGASNSDGGASNSDGGASNSDGGASNSDGDNDSENVNEGTFRSVCEQLWCSRMTP